MAQEHNAPKDPSSDTDQLPSYDQSTTPKPPSSQAQRNKHADPSYLWGITPKPSSYTHNKPIWELPPDHPVHAMPEAEREELRKKGVNPVLKAEMDKAVWKKGSEEKSGWKRFWRGWGLSGGINIK